ncbi:hypothetical protein BT93_K2153 [Corymbia citriodora subsp. variegata]|nr:hypothetical protein BT93_K2153 [Corymbia citriodora subsp. variegata]
MVFNSRNRNISLKKKTQHQSFSPLLPSLSSLPISRLTFPLLFPLARPALVSSSSSSSIVAVLPLHLLGCRRRPRQETAFGGFEREAQSGGTTDACHHSYYLLYLYIHNLMNELIKHVIVRCIIMPICKARDIVQVQCT